MAGYTITKSDYEKQLREQSKSLTGGKTWAELYQSNYLAGERAKAMAEESYLDAAAQAYQSSLGQRSNILESNLGQGYKQQALTDTDLALQEAYNTYMSKYAEKANEIATSVASNASKFDEAVASEAEWMEKTGQSVEDYFNYLYNTYYTVDEETGVGVLNKDYESVNPFVQNELIWGRYLKHPVTEKGEDTSKYMLKSPEELSAMLYDIDEQGNRVLNTLGQDFYDMVMNYMPTPIYDKKGNLIRTDIEQAKSYSDYLQEKDKDLYDYLTSSDLYNINTAGSKFGTFKELMGLDANDYEYSWLERAGGMSREEVDKLFGDFSSYITKMDNEISKFDLYAHDHPTYGVHSNAPKILGKVKEYNSQAFKKISQVAEKLGLDDYSKIYDSMATALDKGGESIESLQTEFNKALEMWGMPAVDKMGKYYTAMTIGTGEIAGRIGGPLAGAAAAAVVGLVTLVIWSINYLSVLDRANQEEFDRKLSYARMDIAKKLRDGYKNSLDSLIDTAKSYAKE